MTRTACRRNGLPVSRLCQVAERCKPMADPRPLRLGVNIDHVATIRNARGGDHPDPVKAALTAAAAGADGITAHLREDRRHIRDDDISALMAALAIPLNLDRKSTRLNSSH